jgi:membrane protein involved in colicin uptake
MRKLLVLAAALAVSTAAGCGTDGQSGNDGAAKVADGAASADKRAAERAASTRAEHRARARREARARARARGRARRVARARARREALALARSRARAKARAAERREAERLAAPPESNCDENYSGCLAPDASDYDCEGGSGDGPEYTGTVTVLGDDHYDLNRDDDNIACDP